MLSYQWQAVEIDRCPACSCVWLDAGELETLVELGNLPTGPLRAALAAARDGRRSRRRCPVCPRRLRRAHLGTSPEIVLDRCPQGHGLWFDRGEVAQVVQSFSQGEAGLIARFLGELLQDDAAHAAGR